MRCERDRTVALAHELRRHLAAIDEDAMFYEDVASVCQLLQVVEMCMNIAAGSVGPASPVPGGTAR